MEEKTEGALLHATAYLGAQKILKIFTPDAGLISLIAKKPMAALSSPFCIAEWVYRKGKKEIHLLTDATLLDDLSDLKQSYTLIEAAGAMAQDLLSSQFPAKKGRGLYALLLAYLKKLPAFPHPHTLAASFRLKLLLHEGLLALQPECAQCGNSASHLADGESVCSSHAGVRSHSFDDEEWVLLQTLAYARQFAPLQALVLTTELQDKIGVLFEERIRQ